MTITREAAQEYTQSLGQTLSGGWRLVLWAKQQGIPEALGMSTEAWVKELGGYVRMDAEERREAVKELTAPVEDGGHGLTQHEAAEVLGVGVGTVNRDLHVDDPVPIGTSEHDDDIIDVQECGDSVPVGTPGSIEEIAAVTGTQSLDEETREPADSQEKSKGAHVGKNSGDNEWYTPGEFIKAAVVVMGAIDLDPASSETANRMVGAAKFYSQENDGMAQAWYGRVWMNPPYAQPLVDRFCTRLAREYQDGSVTEACVLVNNATETNWFQEVLAAAAAVCFPRGRIKFWHPSKKATPLQGQAVIYLGPNAPEFRAEFLRFGPVGMF